MDNTSKAPAEAESSSFEHSSTQSCAQSTEAADSDNRFLIKVCEDIPTLEECYRFVISGSSGARGHCGAVSTFVGITRDNFGNRTVKELYYEGYVPMAVKELEKLCRAACVLHPDLYRIAIVHRLGACPVGMASVIIAASSPHRLDAIHAVENLINELKATVPIWKLEVYQEDDEQNGTSVWKENVEWHQGKPRRIMVPVISSSGGDTKPGV
jgi:molybdopterin synthase catalytic subunit